MTSPYDQNTPVSPPSHVSSSTMLPFPPRFHPKTSCDKELATTVHAMHDHHMDSLSLPFALVPYRPRP